MLSWQSDLFFWNGMVLRCMPGFISAHVTPSPHTSPSQVQPTASLRSCRCCWATRTCSAGQRKIWCGRASISSWTRSKTVTGLQSWEPSSKERTSWCTGATEPRVHSVLLMHIIVFVSGDSEPPLLHWCLCPVLQVWRISLQRPIWSIRSLSIWTHALEVENSYGKRVCWRKVLGFVTELRAAHMSFSCFIGSQAIPNTSTVLRGKKPLLFQGAAIRQQMFWC